MYNNLNYEKAYISIADDEGILEAVTIEDGSFAPDAQPDYPRNITIEVTTSTIDGGTVTVIGLDLNGQVISEVLDLAEDLTLVGTLNFASVTSIVVADLANEDPGDTIQVGTGSSVQLTLGTSFLASVTVNGGAGTVGSYKIIDNSTGTTANVAILKEGIAAKTYTYNVVLKTGLRVVMAGDEVLTVNYAQL